MATSYSWANPAAGGTWQNAANWNPSTGYPLTTDTANIADSTASRTITYSATTSTGVGTLMMTQANNFLNELDVQQSGTISLTVANSFTLSAAGTGTSDFFLDPVLAAKTGLGTVVAPSIAINSGGVLEMSSYDNIGTVALSALTSNLTIGGGTFYSDLGVGTASANQDANLISGSVTMSSGTISLGQHLAGAGSNAVKSGAAVSSVNDRLTIVGSVAITGGTLSVGDATDVLFLEGASNSIQVTGNGAIGGSVTVSSLASGTQTFQTDSAVPNAFTIRQLATSVPASYLQLGSVSGGTLSIGTITFRDGGVSQSQAVQLVSNVSSSFLPKYTADGASDNHVIDTNGFTFDATGYNGTFILIYGTTGSWQLTNSKGSAAVGTIKAIGYDLSGPTGGLTVGSYVNLVATGVGTTSNLSNTYNSSTIDPTSTFTYAGTATGVGSLTSSRNIGNLAVTSQTLNLGSAITTGTGSTVTIASVGTLNLNGFVLTTSNFTNNGGVLNGATASSALSVTGTLAGTGTISGAAGIISSGSLAPGGLGTVGTLKVANGSGALTLGSASTSNFDFASDSSYDTMVLNSVAVTFAGTLNLNFLGGYTPTLGKTYTIFNGLGAGESTNFSTITSNLSGYTFDFNDSSGVLTVDSVPEPALIGLAGVSALMLLRRRRRTATESPAGSQAV